MLSFSITLRKYRCIVILFLISTFIKAQNYQWAYSYGSKKLDDGTDITSDSLGNIYVVGGFRDTLDFDPGPLTMTLSAGVYIAKVKPNGSPHWVRALEGGYGIFPKQIVTDRFGSCYIVGACYGTPIDFDPGPGIDLQTPTLNAYTGFVLKLDSSGNYVWSKLLKCTTCSCGLNAIEVDPFGDLILGGGVGGNTNAVMDFDPGPNNTNFVITNAGYGFHEKLSSAGGLVWYKTWDGGSPVSISLDISGNIYAIGSFGGTISYQGSFGSTNLTSNGSSDIVISKFDNNGGFFWAKSFGGPGQEYSREIRSDHLGNIHISGSFVDTVDFDPGPAFDNHSSMGNNDVFISKFDQNGNYLGCNTIGGAGYMEGASIAIDKYGNLYAAGSFSGTIDFFPGPSTDNKTCSGWMDGFLTKFDSNGFYANTKVFHGLDTIGGCFPASITVFESNVYAIGILYGTIDFDPDASTEPLTYVGVYDAFILKLGACNGKLKADSISTICEGESVSITASGAYNYTWTPGNFITDTIIVNPASTTIYTVTGPKSSDCIGSALISVAVDPCTGIKDVIHEENSLVVFPNPNSGSFAIKGTEAISLSLTNELGQTVQKVNLDHDNNFENWFEISKPGVYFLKGNNFCKKIVVLQ